MIRFATRLGALVLAVAAAVPASAWDSQNSQMTVGVRQAEPPAPAPIPHYIPYWPIAPIKNKVRCEQDRLLTDPCGKEEQRSSVAEKENAPQ